MRSATAFAMAFNGWYEHMWLDSPLPRAPHAAKLTAIGPSGSTRFRTSSTAGAAACAGLAWPGRAPTLRDQRLANPAGQRRSARFSHFCFPGPFRTSVKGIRDSAVNKVLSGAGGDSACPARQTRGRARGSCPAALTCPATVVQRHSKQQPSTGVFILRILSASDTVSDRPQLGQSLRFWFTHVTRLHAHVGGCCFFKMLVPETHVPMTGP